MVFSLIAETIIDGHGVVAAAQKVSCDEVFAIKFAPYSETDFRVHLTDLKRSGIQPLAQFSTQKNGQNRQR